MGPQMLSSKKQYCLFWEQENHPDFACLFLEHRENQKENEVQGHWPSVVKMGQFCPCGWYFFRLFLQSWGWNSKHLNTTPVDLGVL